ncbi:MAG: LysR family transcriptional regulator [Meiothermus sp.]
MVNLEQLRTFLAVYRARSVSKAAEALNLTQPAVTKQLKSLEARLGKPLFTRVPRGVIPTLAAEALAREAGIHLDALEALSSTFKLGARTLEGTVYLGGPGDFLGAKVLPALAGLHEQGVKLRVKLGMPESLVEELEAGALDLVISTVRLSRKGLEFVPVYQETFVLVAGLSWAGRLSAVNAETLAKVPLLAYSEDLPILRRYWRQVLGKNLQDSASVVIEDLRALALAVQSGAGVSVLPRYIVEDAIALGRLVQLLKPAKPPTNTLYLASRLISPHPRATFVRQLLLDAARSW